MEFVAVFVGMFAFGWPTDLELHTPSGSNDAQIDNGTTVNGMFFFSPL